MEQLASDLQNLINRLTGRIDELESATPQPIATPTPTRAPAATPAPTATATPTPAIAIEATPSPTPTSVAGTTGDPCVERLAGSRSVSGAWASGCLTANPPTEDAYYARFYTFTLSAASEVTITLSSADAAPYLYLLNGAGTGGAIQTESGAPNAATAAITRTLQPGAYTIEATTYYAKTLGDFTLELEITR